MFLALVHSVFVESRSRGFEAFAIYGIELCPGPESDCGWLAGGGERTPKKPSFSSLPSNPQSEHYSRTRKDRRRKDGVIVKVVGVSLEVGGLWMYWDTDHFFEMRAEDGIVDFDGRRGSGVSHEL
jgi:hypothetical protein